MAESILVLGIDTCGPTGSVALGRLEGNLLEVLGQTELAGRSYSTTLVAAVGDLLSRAGFQIKDVGAIVVVNGPGSFTGVRVGLSAVKGLAEPHSIPVAAVSRLAVLSAKAGLTSGALDAHRHEVFLRVGADAGETRSSWQEQRNWLRSSTRRHELPFATNLLPVCLVQRGQAQK